MAFGIETASNHRTALTATIRSSCEISSSDSSAKNGRFAAGYLQMRGVFRMNGENERSPRRLLMSRMRRTRVARFFGAANCLSSSNFYLDLQKSLRLCKNRYERRFARKSRYDVLGDRPRRALEMRLMFGSDLPVWQAHEDAPLTSRLRSRLAAFCATGLERESDSAFARFVQNQDSCVWVCE